MKKTRKNFAVLLAAILMLTLLPMFTLRSALALSPGNDAAWMGNWTDQSSPAALLDPSDIAADNNGNIYVVDYTYQLLWKYTASTGLWTTITPSGQMYPGRRFKWVAVDGAGNVYIAATETYAPGYPLVLMYKEGSGWSDITHGNLFQEISGIAADSKGNVYAIDARAAIPNVSPNNTSAVYRLAAGTNAWVGITGSFTGGIFNNPSWTDWSSPFRAPIAVAVDKNDNVYVVTEQFTYATTLFSSAIYQYNNTPGDWDALFSTRNLVPNPTGLAIDSQGVFYVSDSVRKYVYAIFPASDTIYQIENAPGGTNLFQAPAGIAVDGKDNVYALDMVGGAGKVYKHIAWVNQIAWTTHPGGGVYEDQPLGSAPAVLLKTTGGETVTVADAALVALALTTPSGAVLNGTKSKTWTSGAASFPGLSVDTYGTYTLTASSTLQSSQITRLFSGGIYYPGGETLYGATIRSAPSNSFTIGAYPPIEGTLGALTLDGSNGRLTATVSGGSGVYVYTWSVAGQGAPVNTPSGNTYLPAASELGKAITCTVTKAERKGSLTASETVYRADITASGAQGADAVAIRGFTRYGKHLDTMIIDYTLANIGNASNTLTYSGKATPPIPVTAPGSSSSYTQFVSGDAVNGVITLVGTFAHTNHVLTGTVGIDVNSADGTLTANTSAVTGGSGAFAYAWSGESVTDSGAATLPVENYNLGQELTLTLTRADAPGSQLTATIKVYKVEASLSGNIPGDSITIAGPYGKVGSQIAIAYVVSEAGTANGLTLSGPGDLFIPEEPGGSYPSTDWIVSVYPLTGSINYPIPNNVELGGIITIGAAFWHEGYTPPPLRGDANCDGVVDAKDAAAILRHLAGLSTLTPQGEINALVSGGTSVSAVDAAMILRYLAGLITVL
ncbi:MAG: dockerin type I domain-containing protein [Clostridiales bacterium]|nr:dockerin type I domain-containing protein [Clostridiales bacterium]